MGKKIIYTNVEKVERNKKIVAYIDGITTGKKKSFREAAKKFNLLSSGTVFKIYKRNKLATK